MRNLTTELRSLKVKKVVWLKSGVNLESNFAIDNDKFLGGTPEERMLLKVPTSFYFKIWITQPIQSRNPVQDQTTYRCKSSP